MRRTRRVILAVAIAVVLGTAADCGSSEGYSLRPTTSTHP